MSNFKSIDTPDDKFDEPKNAYCFCPRCYSKARVNFNGMYNEAYLSVISPFTFKCPKCGYENTTTDLIIYYDDLDSDSMNKVVLDKPNIGD